jgi:hypothetical protein
MLYSFTNTVPIFLWHRKKSEKILKKNNSDLINRQLNNHHVNLAKTKGEN